jgi:hypothetical protein
VPTKLFARVRDLLKEFRPSGLQLIYQIAARDRPLHPDRDSPHGFGTLPSAIGLHPEPVAVLANGTEAYMPTVECYSRRPSLWRPGDESARSRWLDTSTLCFAGVTRTNLRAMGGE